MLMKIGKNVRKKSNFHKNSAKNEQKIVKNTASEPQKQKNFEKIFTRKKFSAKKSSTKEVRRTQMDGLG